MVLLFGILSGLFFTYVGWVFFKNPQTGFKIHNWPFVSPRKDGLTEAGKPAYRVKGVVIIALGLLLLGIGLFAN